VQPQGLIYTKVAGLPRFRNEAKYLNDFKGTDERDAAIEQNPGNRKA
jgi:hypothetical protein